MGQQNAGLAGGCAEFRGLFGGEAEQAGQEQVLMSGGLTVLADTPRFQRKMRRPRHDFNVRHMPFCITPFAIAPVLPGETLKDGNLQSRAVVDPIKNPLIGWWLEHYVFYVPHGAMPKAQSWQDMVLEPNRDMSGDLTAAASL